MFSEVLKKLADKNADAFHHAPVTIGFLGDSVTNGCFEVLPALTDHGEEGIDVVFDPENSYSAHFRQMLLNLYPKAQINIINAGISKVIIRDDAVNYRVIDVQEWVDNDDSLSGQFGY